MESKNIKTSTIQFIEKEGTWSNGDHTYQKYKLHLNNGEKPQFLAKSEKTIDDFNIGDEVKYSYKKAGQPFAKIEKEFNQPKIKQMPNTKSSQIPPPPQPHPQPSKNIPLKASGSSPAPYNRIRLPLIKSTRNSDWFTLVPGMFFV